MNYGIQLKEKLHAKKAIGGHVFLQDPAISEALAIHGYDFIWIDGEHAAFDRATIQNHVIAANAGGAAAIVRVAGWTMEAIKPILEMGVDGIIIPQTKGYEDAKAALAECLYPPRGVRGFGPRRSIRYNALSMEEYSKIAEEEVVRIIQIEHYQAIAELDQTLTLDGLDALVLGPNDLASSMGFIGDPTHPEVMAKAKKAITKANAKNIPIGVSMGPDPDLIALWWEYGVDFISSGDDISFLRQGAVRTIEEIKKGAKR